MRNVKRNRNVTMLVDVEEPTVKGVLIYDKAELEYSHGRDHYISEGAGVFERYMPRDEAERRAAGLLKITKGNRAKIIVRPERMASFDVSKDEAIRNTAQG